LFTLLDFAVCTLDLIFEKVVASHHFGNKVPRVKTRGIPLT